MIKEQKMRTIFYHEDDYCQWEILPLAAMDFCLKEMGEIDEFAEKHRAGLGFTDMYVREDSPHTTKELALRPEQLAAALDFLPVYDQVETGYSAHREICTTTQARGENEDMVVFWSLDGAGLVDTIWLGLWIKPETKEWWRKILTALGRVAPVLLADWGWSQCVDLTSEEQIDRYVEEKTENG